MLLFRTFKPRMNTPRVRLSQMTTHLSNGFANGLANSAVNGSNVYGVSLDELPKSNIFTSTLPADEKFPTPEKSHNTSRDQLGPRMVKNALYTYVRPETIKEPELLGVSYRAMRDIGLKEGEEKTEEFKQMVAGNKFFWNEETKEGIYPWAQCYGGWQFGSWAGQLGDGRAISLFESTNLETGVRYEIQLKGAGITPYSRFADGKAVLRSSVREFVVSEALNALNIPSTRALALTLTPHVKVRRETLEPGAIVTRFAQSWLRIGTFDILRARGDRDLIRKLATYVGENVFPGWASLPAAISKPHEASEATLRPPSSVPFNEIQGEKSLEENRYTRLYRQIARVNAITVARWQAYAFTNGVLNTDNTSILGLSLDFGPFAFLDNFDPSYTPNHDDHMLRYSYRNQPSIIWWNLVRLGESLGELIGAGPKVDDEEFINEGVSDAWAPELIQRAEGLIERAGTEFKTVFLAEYTQLMTARLGLKTHKDSDFKELISELLDTMEALELDFNHFFRRLSNIRIEDLTSPETARIFLHAENREASTLSSLKRLTDWLHTYQSRLLQDWANSDNPSDDPFAPDSPANTERLQAMKAVNPKFTPRSFVLDELIKDLTPAAGHEPDTAKLQRLMKVATAPFEDNWEGVPREEVERWCGDVPRTKRMAMCSCSS